MTAVSMWLAGGIELENTTRATADLLEADLDPEVERIDLHVSSYGGDPLAALAMAAHMRRMSTPVHTYAHGAVYSAGVVIFTAGHVRIALPTSMLMVHPPSSHLDEGSHSSGVQRENLRQLTWLAKQCVRHVKACCPRVSEEVCQAMLEDQVEDFWLMGGREAVRHGLADRVLRLPPHPCTLDVQRA